MKHIAIFASGSGSNAEEIVKFFNSNNAASVSLILSNKADAYVLERAKKYDIPTITFNRNQLKDPDQVLAQLKDYDIDFIVLAGFLWLMPVEIIKAYPNKIVNIHPALLPKYGGKGMYGMKVHEAVVENKEMESGITIHFVNEKYDEGKIILQAKCSIESSDTPEMVAQKVHALEYEHYPKVIASLL